MKKGPLVSIIMPCKNVDNFTLECIEHCRRLDYTSFETILLPDYSTTSIEGVITIPTGPVSPGLKRNIGAANSKGEFCAFIDNDAYPRKDWLSNALKHLESSGVSGVGGPGLTPDTDDLKQKAGGYVLSSFMVGALSNRYKTRKSIESNDIHSCNFVARKADLIAAGGWNEKYWPGEDTLMCLALKKLGKKLVESPDVVVYHHRRSLFKPHLLQVSRFGEHRGFFAKKFPENSVKAMYFLPSLLILFLLVGAILSFVFPLFAYFVISMAVVYALLSLLAASMQAESMKITLYVWLGIILTHIVYGSFFLLGLIRRDLRR